MSYRSFSLVPSCFSSDFSSRFNRMDKIFSRLTGEKRLSNYPSYNFIKVDDLNYELKVNVPGYKRKELNIFVQNKKLKIEGRKKNKSLIKNKEKIIHEGIEKSDFSLSFNLDHEFIVKSASLKLGQLILFFYYKILEKEKPKKIFITSQ